MKLVDLFKVFLADVVNLNETRVADLESSIAAIQKAVTASAWSPKILGWAPQGSWAHKTIIKPVDQGEFDADLLVYVQPVEGWSAAAYIDELYSALKASDTYKDKVKRWSHCVTITYARQKKIDVAPCVVDRDDIQRFEVCNRDSDQFERTEPRAYTDWLVQQNSYSGSNSFRKVTRLIKYLRDIKTTFTCPSVLLTTLLGYRIAEGGKDTDAFADTPTALKTVFQRLDEWLQARPTKPAVTNPFLASEDFADGWSDEQYTNFRDLINKYRGWIDEAYDEQNRNESIAKWRRVFGDEFARDVVLAEGKSSGTNAVALLKSSLSSARNFAGDLVDAVRRFGAAALHGDFDRQAHMKSPKWRRVPVAQRLTVRVSAKLYRSKGYDHRGSVESLQILSPGQSIVFSVGTPLSTHDYDVKWRVTNTDEAASNDNALRGGFYDSEAGLVRWEELKYRGVHLVEAFVIRKRDGALVGQSEAFRVVIE